MSRVSETGPSSQAGLRKGDKLLKVNGQDLVKADHHCAVEVLRNVGTEVDMVIERSVEEEPVVAKEAMPALSVNSVVKPSLAEKPLVVHHGPSPVSEKLSILSKSTEPDAALVILQKDANGLGFSIAGGKGSAPLRNDSEVSLLSINFFKLGGVRGRVMS